MDNDQQSSRVVNNVRRVSKNRTRHEMRGQQCSRKGRQFREAVAANRESSRCPSMAAIKQAGLTQIIVEAGLAHNAPAWCAVTERACALHINSFCLAVQYHRLPTSDWIFWRISCSNLVLGASYSFTQKSPQISKTFLPSSSIRYIS